jgi:translation initiation factor IF-2
MTFIDTPGHAAFTSVREKSASAADIAILIVSAEDGVMQQTKEALKSITNAKLPYIVAINKVDSPKADIAKTKQSLLEAEIYIEGYGGTTPVVEISALKGTGVSDLLDLINLTAEMEAFEGDPTEAAIGSIIEANTDSRTGVTATMIIKNGTLKTGQFVSCGRAYAPVRIIETTQGEKLKEASFTKAIKISGWNGIPFVGEEFQTFNTKKEAEAFLVEFEEIIEKKHKPILGIVPEDTGVLPIIIKADTEGSVAALEQEIEKIDHERLNKRVIYTGTGNIGEADVKIASGDQKPVIIGFNVKTDTQAKAAIEREGVSVHTSTIIYDAIDWLQKESLSRIPKITVDEESGKVKLLRIFSESKKILVCGGRVEEGEITLNAKVKIMRRGEEIGTAKVSNLQRVKEVVERIGEGEEFGMSLTNRTIEPAPGDHLIPFRKVTK